MTDYTTNFNLEKYQTGDAANLNDQYNASMDIIDTISIKSTLTQTLRAVKPRKRSKQHKTTPKI